LKRRRLLVAHTIEGEKMPVAGAEKEKWWKYTGTGVNTPGKAIFAGLLVFVGGIVVLTSWGIPPLNIYPVVGRSMEPTIHQWLWVPAPNPSLRWRGALVHLNRHLKPVIGNIVMFHDQEGRASVKRVAEIRKDGALWVTADNVGVTGADSREYGWIPASAVIGVVDQIYTPARLLRAVTREGRLWNWAVLRYSPSQIKLFMKDLIFVVLNGEMHLIRQEGANIETQILEGRWLGWADNKSFRWIRWAAPTDLPNEYRVLDLVGCHSKKIHVNTCMLPWKGEGVIKQGVIRTLVLPVVLPSAMLEIKILAPFSQHFSVPYHMTWFSAVSGYTELPLFYLGQAVSNKWVEMEYGEVIRVQVEVMRKGTKVEDKIK